jgi:glycine/D-amino acid oxidase-like deaminating enzyme
MAAYPFFADDVKFTPYWWETAPLVELGEVALPMQVDLAIVGAGYSGLSAAITAVEGGLDTLVLDAQALGEGASTRNGGAVGETLRISYSAMESLSGRDRAQAFYIGVREARAYLEHLIENDAIACQYGRVGRFVGAHRPQDYETLARDLEVRRKAIGFEAEMIPAAETHRVIGSDAYHGGRLIHSDGNLQPAELHRGLVRRAMAAGARLAPHTRVTGFSREGAGFLLRTARGDVSARHLVVATNGYTDGLAPWLRRRLVPIQSQIIATEPLPAATMERLAPARRQFGDTRRLHNYFRASPDGTRILFGGRAGASDTANRRRSAAALRDQMVSVYPELASARITHAWAGFIAYTFDALPHMACHDGVHYIGGCCGSGVAMQPYLGHKTGLKVLGRKEADTPFDNAHPSQAGYSGSPWFMPAVIFYFGWRDRLRI